MTDPLESLRCGVFGCPNDAIRLLEHKTDARVKMPLCAFHVRRASLYLTDEQLGRILWTLSKA